MSVGASSNMGWGGMGGGHLHCRLDALDHDIQPDLVVLLELKSLGYLLQGHNFSGRRCLDGPPKK